MSFFLVISHICISFCIPLSNLLCADWTKDLYMYVIEFVGYYFLFFLFFVFCICILYFVFRISIIFPLRPCLRRLNPGAAGAHLSSPPLARSQSFLVCNRNSDYFWDIILIWHFFRYIDLDYDYNLARSQSFLGCNRNSQLF